jgi:hypothetical protein
MLLLTLYNTVQVSRGITAAQKKSGLLQEWLAATHIVRAEQQNPRKRAAEPVIFKVEKVAGHNPDGMQVQFPCTLVARALAPPVLMPLSIALPLVLRRSCLSCFRPATLKPPINILAIHSPQTDSHSPKNLSIVSADQLTEASLRHEHPASPSPGPLISGTSYNPTLQNVMVPKRLATGLLLDDLYFISICAIRHTLHKSLYGQYAYSLVRMEVSSSSPS